MPRKQVETADKQPTIKKLTGLQAAFVIKYFELNFNGVRAAEAAGYKGDYNTLCVTAHRLLHTPKIKTAIEDRLAEYGMSANEAIARLAHQARGDIDDLLTEDGSIDLAKARAAGKTGLIKKMEIKRKVLKLEVDDLPAPLALMLQDFDGKGQIIDEHVKLELYDAQAAILAIIKENHLQKGESTENVGLTWEALMKKTDDTDDPFS